MASPVYIPIYKESIVLSNKGILTTEEKYGGTFIGDFCLKTKEGQWANEPVAVFYQPNPPKLSPKGNKCTNYFGILFRGGTPYIVNAISVLDTTITGFIDKCDGAFIYSRFRHDYRTDLSGKLFMDGGRDYLRTNVSPEELITVEIVEDKLVKKEKSSADQSSS